MLDNNMDCVVFFLLNSGCGKCSSSCMQNIIFDY